MNEKVNPERALGDAGVALGHAVKAGRKLPQWTEADLDRCSHGRHSIDDCASCPRGSSEGNLFPERGIERTREDGTRECCIGTTVAGRTIWVVVRRPNIQRDLLDDLQREPALKTIAEALDKVAGVLAQADEALMAIHQDATIPQPAELSGWAHGVQQARSAMLVAVSEMTDELRRP